MNGFKQHLDFLIGEGRRDYSSCAQDEKELLTATFIQQNPRKHETFLADCDDYSTAINMLTRYMITGDSDHKEILIDQLKKMSVEFFYKEISEIFDAEIADRNQCIAHESGFRKQYHLDNGETYWVRP